MGNKSKKARQRRNLKQVKNSPKKKISWIPLYFFLLVLILGSSIFVISKTMIHKNYYNNYLIFLEKTKVVLYPDIMQKDQRSNLIDWLTFNKRYMNQYKSDLSYLFPLLDQIEQKEKKESWEEAKTLVQEFRIEMAKKIKGKNYYSQTIMMEELLSLILEIEKSVDKKDSLKLMEQYQDFNSKFTFVIPVLIKKDVIKIGDSMDQIYKKALFQTLDDAKPIYQELKQSFIASYRDYKVN